MLNFNDLKIGYRIIRNRLGDPNHNKYAKIVNLCLEAIPSPTEGIEMADILYMDVVWDDDPSFVDRKYTCYSFWDPAP